MLGGEPDGRFAHTPEPTEENLQSVLAKVRKANADVGFCQDPDADRLAVIDASGRYIGEEYTVPLCVGQVLRTRKKGAIVINCATSRMTIDIARQHGVECYRSAVGEANVVDLLNETGAVFAGEGNGGPIDPAVGLVRDSFVGMAQILEAMATQDKTIAELTASLPVYAMLKRKRTIPFDKVPQLLDEIEKRYPAQEKSRLDGLRIDWLSAWVLIRASNTEPIVRTIAEAPTPVEAASLCDEIDSIPV